jgi:hypothetical protein
LANSDRRAGRAEGFALDNDGREIIFSFITSNLSDRRDGSGRAAATTYRRI